MNLVSKKLMVKEESFYACTCESVLVMTAITSGTKINWSTVLYNVLVDMIIKHATGFVVQISKMFLFLEVPIYVAQD